MPLPKSVVATALLTVVLLLSLTMSGPEDLCASFLGRLVLLYTVISVSPARIDGWSAFWRGLRWWQLWRAVLIGSILHDDGRCLLDGVNTFCKRLISGILSQRGALGAAIFDQILTLHSDISNLPVLLSWPCLEVFHLNLVISNLRFFYPLFLNLVIILILNLLLLLLLL